MKLAYSNKELFEIAKDNYQTLVFHCVKLHTEGYWTDPERLLKQTIRQQLDLYLQAVLLMFAAHSGSFSAERNHFVRAIPDSNMLKIREDGEMSEEDIRDANRVLHTPPILLQLFALRDREKHTHLTVMFLDTLLNIVIAMSYLEEQNGQGVVEFIREYSKGVSAFLNEECSYLKTIDDRYVFRKIASPTFKTGYIRDEIEYARETVTISESKEEDEATADSAKKEEQEAAVVYNEEDIARETAKARLSLEQARDAKRAALAEKRLEELNALVGLDKVKEEMQSLVNLIKVRKMRQNYQLPQMDMSYHMVFTGNAGTGKTTVARMVAQIYKELGVLSKGTFVETDRAGLVAGYLGQTAMKVKEVVKQAKGGVLFIDEAYSLTSWDAGDDYGIEAIDTLVKEMEDNRGDLVVIVAGYRDEMERFLKANTGLVSRFNKYIDFEDYTQDQLLEILRMMAEKAGMTIQEEALTLVREYLMEMKEEKRHDFGNARGIRNVFERIVTNQANRLVGLGEPSLEQLKTILPEDVAELD